MDQIRPRLESLPFWDKLTPDQQEDLTCSAVIQQYAQGSIVHGCGSDCLGMILVLQGALRVYLLSEEGREVTLFYLRQGEPCVLSAECVVRQIAFDSQMTAEENCTLLVINSNAIGRLSQQNIYARCFFYELATERFSSVMWTMQQILFMRVDKRLATFLLQESERTGLSVVKMTHEQIAQQISSTREVVARILKRFSNEGLVEVRRGSIRLLDPAGLQQLTQ